MLWFGKKKDKENSPEIAEIDEDLENVSEEEILGILENGEDESAEADEVLDGESFDIESEDDSEEDEQSDEESETPDVTDVIKTITSLEELAVFANAKKVGNIIYMRKGTNEFFALRENHFRIASVWGTVSMAREYTPTEYAKIMLAAEIMETPDAFMTLPSLTDEERAAAIEAFCDEKYGNGKKYAKNTAKFAKTVSVNEDKDEWMEYSNAIVLEKLKGFCEENGIELEASAEASVDSESEEEINE